MIAASKFRNDDSFLARELTPQAEATVQHSPQHHPKQSRNHYAGFNGQQERFSLELHGSGTNSFPHTTKLAPTVNAHSDKHELISTRKIWQHQISQRINSTKHLHPIKSKHTKRGRNINEKQHARITCTYAYQWQQSS